MKIEKGQYIECALKNGWVISGTVDDINSTALQMTRSDGKGTVIIMRPNEEILVIKIPNASSNESLIRQDKKEDVKIDEVSMPHENQDKLKTLTELRVAYLDQEKEEIANKLRSHEVGDVRKVEYGYPGFFQKPSSK